jgi:hypothetical protein
MESRTGPVTDPELLGDEPVRLPRLKEAAGDLRRGTASIPHRRWWWVLAIVLVVASTGIAVDGSMRARDGARVAACEHQLRVATWYTQRHLGLVSNYLEPTLSPSGRVQDIHLADLMSAHAFRALPRVRRADRVCRHVTVRPWHFSLVKRQSAATAYSAALVTMVQTVAAQGRLPFRGDATLQRLGDEVGVGGS